MVNDSGVTVKPPFKIYFGSIEVDHRTEKLNIK